MFQVGNVVMITSNDEGYMSAGDKDGLKSCIKKLQIGYFCMIVSGSFIVHLTNFFLQ